MAVMLVVSTPFDAFGRSFAVGDTITDASEMETILATSHQSFVRRANAPDAPPAPPSEPEHA
jgi:hypothetical protein